LHGLIADGQQRTSLFDRNTWIGLVADSSMQNNCNLAGFNVQGGYAFARIGFIANQEGDCGSW